MSILLKPLPGPLDLVNASAGWDVANDSELLLKAGPKTDRFTDINYQPRLLSDLRTGA